MFLFFTTIKAIANQIVNKESTQNQYTTTTVTCPQGTSLTGGGGHCMDLAGKGSTYLKLNFPVDNKNWSVRCESPLKEQQVKAIAYAICAEDVVYAPKWVLA